MSLENIDDKLLPHHEQQALCTTRLPYRQGRKLTAVKVYTINNESNHLLIFGVPSLNLRQEAKALFQKFGRLKLFNLAKYKSEQFTETYHAAFERIQSARMAKRMLDTKNFYGGSLHVTYAPELEDLEETRTKLLQRQHDVLTRLKNLQNEEIIKKEEIVKNTEVEVQVEKVKLNMGEANIIHINGSAKRRKCKSEVKSFKPCFIETFAESILSKKSEPIGPILSKKTEPIGPIVSKRNEPIGPIVSKRNEPIVSQRTERIVGKRKNEFKSINVETIENTDTEIIDCSSADIETITNVNEHEKNDCIKIYKIPERPLNKIKFNLSKKS